MLAGGEGQGVSEEGPGWGVEGGGESEEESQAEGGGGKSLL